jgi:3-deoxy-7-phosphoheptulonate synthase
MIIVLKRNSSETDIATISDLVCSMRYQPRVIRGTEQTVVACIGDELSHQSLEVLRNLPAVESVFPVQKKFKLVSREYHPDDSVVDVRGVKIGGGNIEVIAGPCAIESYDQFRAAVRTSSAAASASSAPCPSSPAPPLRFPGPQARRPPDHARGQGRVRCRHGLRGARPRPDRALLGVADMFQIGARNAQNYDLLEQIAQAGKPVLLKRGLASTVEEWLTAAEYLIVNNCPRSSCASAACARSTPARATCSTSAPWPSPAQLSHLPVMVDPSHAAGARRLVPAAGPRRRWPPAPTASSSRRIPTRSTPSAMPPSSSKAASSPVPRRSRPVDRPGPQGTHRPRPHLKPEGHPMKTPILYLGPEGTHSHEAALRRFGPKAKLIPCLSHYEVFARLCDPRARPRPLAIVPVENSSEGPVTQTLDQLAGHPGVGILDSFSLPVPQHLMALKGTKLSGIRRICSHPQVLGQCRATLARLLPRAELVPDSSTAAAAGRAAQDPATAAIASEAAAKLHHLVLLRKDHAGQRRKRDALLHHHRRQGPRPRRPPGAGSPLPHLSGHRQPPRRAPPCAGALRRLRGQPHLHPEPPAPGPPLGIRLLHRGRHRLEIRARQAAWKMVLSLAESGRKIGTYPVA